MQQKAKQFLKHPLIYGSSIVVFGNLFANFFNFLFNLFMSRSLSVADYGVLASIISIIGFPALFANAITPMVMKFAGNYFATGELSMVRGLYMKIIRPLFLIALAIFFLFLIFIPQISNFFHIDNSLILILTDVMIFLIFISVINMSFLQAKLAFVFQVFTTLINTVLKFVLGFIFVVLGLSTTGAVIAMILALIASYIASFFPIKFIFNTKIKSPSVNSRELFSYGIPSALTFLGLTSFISTDIILVKHFFNSHQAGLYAGISLISRVIFFVSAPIGTVMFPVIVQKHSRNENFTNTFKLSLLLVFLPSLLITVFYAIFPTFSVLFFLKKEEYLDASQFLAPFALFIALYSLLSILSNFYLSIKQTRVFIPIISGAILQTILIFFYHETFLQIINISLVITFILVCALLFYYPIATRVIKKDKV
jgi:O-antigen/teichoic acid export membrane protein